MVGRPRTSVVRRWLGNSLLVLGSVLLALWLIEGGLATLLSHPGMLTVFGRTAGRVVSLLRHYYIEHGKLEITPENIFRAFAAQVVQRRRYYPLKHTLELLMIAGTPRRTPSTVTVTDAEEAGTFLDVLLHFATLLKGKTVFVIELNVQKSNNAFFIAALTRLLPQPRYAPLADIVIPVDVSHALTAKDWYVLDDHINTAGHATVARLLAAEFTKRGVLRQP